MKRLLLYILFFQLLILGLHVYVQHIYSPVNQVSTQKEIPAPPDVDVDKEEEEKIEVDEQEIEKQEETPVVACETIQSTIQFIDYSLQQHQLDLEICEEHFKSSVKNRESARGKNAYRPLVKHDFEWLQPVITAYKEKIERLALDKLQAAEFVVASIQNIPYTLVHPFTHEAFIAKYGDILNKYHKRKSHLKPLEQVGGCYAPVNPNGVLSPIEMFFDKRGDCDSRVTALYVVLKALGYDVLELVGPTSSGGGHALLAIHLPKAYGNTTYKFAGKDYFVWETTFFHRKGSRVGHYGDKAFFENNRHLWKVALP